MSEICAFEAVGMFARGLRAERRGRDGHPRLRTDVAQWCILIYYLRRIGSQTHRRLSRPDKATQNTTTSRFRRSQFIRQCQQLTWQHCRYMLRYKPLADHAYICRQFKSRAKRCTLSEDEAREVSPELSSLRAVTWMGSRK